ncbi:hypothetical protein ACGF0J_02855 [Nonomuraea sp. NPDC047897]|uniref:hypothetical protein n=1 Tax=Nonomuraea sp. NPDC047897 TaxID=3364346 RepID=UPI0037144243
MGVLARKLEEERGARRREVAELRRALEVAQGENLELTPRGSYLEAEIDGDLLKIPAHDPDAPADTMAPIAIRVWEPHPRRHLEADSPVRSSLGLLEEPHLLNASVKAIVRAHPWRARRAWRPLVVARHKSCPWWRNECAR